MAYRRIQKELKDLQSQNSTNYHAEPFEGDQFHWRGYITGPEHTPYEGGKFNLDINFPLDYPFKHPKVRFTTQIYHPNINERGCVSIDILVHNWSPALTIAKVLYALTECLVDPNPDNPLCPQIARQYKEDRESFNLRARQMTKKYAT